MNNTKLSILITLFTCTSQGKNHYSLISIDRLIKLLASIHKTHVKRRWVFQCIRDIIDAGLLSRQSRFKHNGDGTINQLSSITAITLKGAKLLVSKRISGAFLLLKKIMAWVKNKDKRFPKKEDVKPSNFDGIDKEELRRLENLAENVLKPT
jgi:hypothetical protein